MLFYIIYIYYKKIKS